MKHWKAALLGITLLVQAAVPAWAGAQTATAIPAQPPTAAQVEAMLKGVPGTVFPIGTFNEGYKDYFTGHTYLKGLSNNDKISLANVTFIQGAHTFWHKHHGSCQILVSESGSGYYQIWGQKPVKVHPGETVTIPENVKHWHGAAPGSMYQHLSIMAKDSSTEWLEPVDQATFAALEK
ncbi:MAG: Carboxymuconolactone decarboxylase [Succiniclasticum sp.]|jgi:quercetin dioxygenase-like cupin family protein